jgi:hypothetical protein
MGMWGTSGHGTLMDRAFSCQEHYRKNSKNYQIRVLRLSHTY